MPTSRERQNARDELTASTHDMVAILIEKIDELTEKIEALSKPVKKGKK